MRNLALPYPIPPLFPDLFSWAGSIGGSQTMKVVCVWGVPDYEGTTTEPSG